LIVCEDYRNTVALSGGTAETFKNSRKGEGLELKRRIVKKLTIPVLLYGGIVLFMFSTDPTKLAIGWLILPFLWIFITLLWSFIKLFTEIMHRDKSPRTIILSVFCAGMPTLVLLLDSISQLTIRDVMLVFVFGLVGYFYVSKLDLRLS
jgi:hypothetical protein